MTVREAAKRIGISASKLYQLLAAKRISHYRIGGKIVLSEADVEHFLETCRVAAAAAETVVTRERPRLKHIKLS